MKKDFKTSTGRPHKKYNEFKALCLDFIGSNGFHMPIPLDLNDKEELEALSTLTHEKIINATKEIQIFGAVIYSSLSKKYITIDALKYDPKARSLEATMFSTSKTVSPPAIKDLAYIKRSLENSNDLNIQSFTPNVIHVDGGYVRGDELDIDQLLINKDVSEEITTQVDKAKLRNFIEGIKYPIYSLDYESIFPEIPVFSGTSAHQQIPFQFSLHVRRSPNSPIEHYEFLHKSRTDPRHDFVKSLNDIIGDKGSVLVFNQSFEKKRNEELAKAFPQYAEMLKKLNARIVDMMPPFKGRKKCLSSPLQNGSASLKTLAPVFLNKDYSALNISNGLETSDKYLAFMNGEIPDSELEQLWEDMLEYCACDTLYPLELLYVLIKYNALENAPSNTLDTVYKPKGLM